MPQGMPGTEYLDPLYQDKLAVERQKQMAEILAAQGQQPLTPNGTVYRGQVQAPIHWSQSLAKVIQAAMGAYATGKADKAEGALAQKYASGREQAIAEYLKAAQGTPGTPDREPLPIAPSNGVGPPKPAMGPPVPGIAATPPADSQGQDRAALMAAASPYMDPKTGAAIIGGRTWAREDAATKQAQELQAELVKERLAQAADAERTRSEDRRYSTDENNARARELAAITAANRPERNKQILPTENGYMEVTPAGLVPVLDKSGKPVRSATAANYDKGYATRLRGEYNSNPEVKLANEWGSRLPSVAQHYLNRDKATDTQKAVGDNELVKAYITATRAEGTRESNLSTSEIAKLPGLPSRIQAAIANFALGKHLPDEVATELYSTVSRKYKELDKQRQAVRKEIISRGELAQIPEGLIFESDNGR